MIAALSNLTAQTAEAQTGLGVVLTEETGQSHIYPQRGSTVQVRLGLPLFVTGGEIESVVMRKRTSWNIISPVHTEYRLELSLRSEAAARLIDFTRDGDDVRLGLLIRDEVVGVIAFAGPITGRKVGLYGFGSRNAAESLADELKTALRTLKR